MISISKNWQALACLCCLVFFSQVFASTKAQLQVLVPQVKTIAADSNIVSAVDAANQAHASLTATDIRNLGKEWHQGLQGKSSDILNQVNGSSLSSDLKTIQTQSNGQYAGILVTDAKGLVIGETYNADHYSQANRSVWRNIAKDGVNAVYYGKAKKSDAGNLATLGLPIVEDNKVVGAILVETAVTASKTSSTKQSAS